MRYLGGYVDFSVGLGKCFRREEAPKLFVRMD